MIEKKMLDTKYLKVLADIQTRANRKFNSKLFTESKLDEDDEKAMMVFDEMLKRDIPEWKRKYLEIMKKDMFKPKQMIDEEVGKQKDKWIDLEIKKAVRKNLLPKEL